MDEFHLFYHRVARVIIVAVVVGAVAGFYFFFYPALDPANPLYILTPRVESIARRMGFVLRATAVDETTFTPSTDIINNVLSAHDVRVGEALPLIPALAIKQSLEQLPMIKSATVTVHYPSHQLQIKLVERVPVAMFAAQKDILTNDGLMVAVDRLAVVPDNLITLNAHPSPAVVAQFIALYNQFQDYSLLLEKLRRTQLVGGRRWRLWLVRPVGNGLGGGYLQIDMPETITPAVMARLSKLVLDDNILNLKIERVDLRLADQTVVELLSPSGNEVVDKKNLPSGKGAVGQKKTADH